MRNSTQSSAQSWIHRVWQRYRRKAPTTKPATRDGIQLDKLEPRLCFSASPIGVDALATVFPPPSMDPLDPLNPEDVAHDSVTQIQNADEVEDAQVEANELIFIDGGVEEPDALADGLLSQFGDAARIYVLNSMTDGIEQITRQLGNHHDISAIHILTHGSSGSVQLGNALLNSESLTGYSADLASWAGSLSTDADILFYGCDLAGSEDGRSLVNEIAELTEADVAASQDKTGDEQLGGNWDLEYQAGQLQALAITQSAVGGWSQLLELTPGSEQLINGDAPTHNIVATTQSTSETGHFSESAVAVASNGNHVIAWTSQGDSGADVFVRVLNKQGDEISPQQMVNDEFTAGNQHSASVAMDADGNFVVVWVTDQDSDGTSNNVYARLYDSSGIANGSAFRVYGNTIASAGDQNRPDVAMNEEGMFAVVWDGAGFGEDFGIAANIYDANGTSLSGVLDVNSAQGNSSIGSSPSIGIDEVGTVSIAWNDDAVISGASFAASGTPITRFTIFSPALTDLEVRNPSIDVREDGMIALAYEYRTKPLLSNWTDWNISVQVLNPAFENISFHSSAAGPENQTNDDENASVTFNEDGSILLTWFGAGTGDNDGVFARRIGFQSDGGTGWQTFGDGPDLLVNETTGGSQNNASVAAIDHDNFVVTWSGNGTGDADGVFTRRFGTGSTNALYLTSKGDVSGASTPGQAGWTSGTILQFGGPDASYEPIGSPPTTTTGEFQSLTNFDDFLDDGDGDIDAFHYVSRDLKIGGSMFQVQAGDLLFSFKDNETTTDGLVIHDGDLALFRPDYVGDNSSGTISIILSGLDDTTLGNLTDIRGISLVEQDTEFGDTTLSAGDFLFTHDGGQEGNDVYVLRTTTVGDGTTDGTVEKLVEGDDLGIGKNIVGIDLIENSGILGDTVLPTGGLLLTVDNDEAFNTADVDATNDFNAAEQDIVLLELEQTTHVAGTAVGTAFLLFDADDVSLTGNSANLNGISVAGLITVAPDLNTDAFTVNEDSGDHIIDVLSNDAYVDGASITFDASAALGTVTLNGNNTFTYTPDGQFESLAVGDVTTDTFSYTVTTPFGSSTTTVVVTVTGVNDNPTSGGLSTTNTEDEAGFVASLLDAASDVDDGDVLSIDAGSITLLSGNAAGVSISGNEISIAPSAYDRLAQGDFEEIVYEYAIVDGNGGSTTVKAVVRIGGINDSPILSPSANFTLDNIHQDDADPTGTSIGKWLDGGGVNALTDVDSPTFGIAVIAAGTTNGQWQFSTDGGSTWTSFSASGVTSAVNENEAVLLDASAMVRFVPVAGYSGTADPLTFRGWDQTSGASGDTNVNAAFAVNSAFSSETNSVSLEVRPPNLVAVDNSYNINEDTTLSVDAGTHLIAWQARRRITIDNSTRSEALTDFPLLVRLDASTIDYGLTQNAGQDLRFVDAIGNQLDHEIESWNEAGTSLVWVRIPEIAANSATDSIWMYYGNSSAVDGQAANSVWSADYQAVYHFDEDAAGLGETLSDSVSGLDGVNQGSSATTGLLEGAQEFDGDDYVDLGTNRPFLRNTSEATLSAWINPDSVSGNGQIVGFLRGPGGHSFRSRFEIVREGDEIAVYGRTTDTTSSSQSVKTSTGAIQAGQWHQVVATIDFSTDTIRIYIDGQEQATTGSVSFTNDSTPDTNSMQGTIGVEEDLLQSFFSGSIDEVRVSDTARSAAWVNAQYAAVKDSLISFGNEETTGGVLENDSNTLHGTVKAVLDTDVSNGTLSFNNDGSFTYTPDADFFGTDSFTYSLTDGSSSESATVTIVVDGLNDDPTAGDDSAAAFQGVATTINVLENDSDIDNSLDPSTVTVTSMSAGVTTVANADGSVDFTASLAGTSSFTYTVTDAAGGISNQATVTVSVSDEVASSLWLSTFGDVDSSNVTGMSSWKNGDALEFGGSAVTYEPIGATTEGSFSRVFGLSAFGVDANVTALHFVSGDHILGSGADTFHVRAGDVLFAVDQDVTLTSTNTTSIEVGDFALFRPDVAGNYSAGRFFQVFDSSPGASQITAATLVERSTTFGGTDLEAGDIIYSAAGDSNVYLLETVGVGVGTTSGHHSVLFSGGGVQIDGLELVERATRLGDIILEAGTLLLSADGAGLVGGTGGSVNVTANDIFAFQSDGSVTTATLVFEGSDVGLSLANEDVDAIALNFGPTVLRALDDAFAVSEGDMISGSVSGNDQVFDASSSTYSLVSSAAHGKIVLRTDGTFDYTHDSSETTADTFRYEITDEFGNTSIARVHINVSPVNDLPVATDDTFDTNEDTELTGSVAPNDSDPESASLAFSIDAKPAHGKLVLDTDGNFTYTPDSHFHGTDTFTYRVDDGNSGFATATVTIDIAPINDAPVAHDDSVTIDEDTVATGNVSINDSDLDGDSLTYTLGSTANHGTLDFRANGKFTYTPDSNFFGTDQFEYVTSDGIVQSTATVTIDVRPVNDAPVASDDLFSEDEDTILSGSVAGNDEDLDDASLTFRLLDGTTRGQLSLNADGSFTYRPNTDFHGIDSFEYEVEDAAGATSIAKASISINAINDAPNAEADLFSMRENETLEQNVTSNDNDVDDTVLSYMLTSPPANGSISFNSDGTFSFTPDAEFVGSVTFEYAVSDPTGATSFATATIEVENVNKAPVAMGDLFSAQEDIRLTGSVGTNDSDPDDDPMLYSLVSGPESGSVRLDQDGSFSFTPDTNQHGKFSFVYRATDSFGLEDTAEVTIDVAAVNDAPVAGDDEFTASVSAPVTINSSELLANDTDAENDSISIQLLDSPANGSISQSPDGIITYVPEPSFVGVDTFTYVATDGNDTSAPASVSITILSVPPLTTTTRTETETVETEAAEETVDSGTSTTNPSTAIGALLAQTIGTDTDNEEGTVVGLLNDTLNSEEDAELESFVANIMESIDTPNNSPSIASFMFSGATASGGFLSNRSLSNPHLKAVQLTDIGTLDFSQYLLESESYMAIVEGMDEFRDTLNSNLALPELAVEGFVAATSSFSVGVALWLLRGGYIVASVISALPAWQTFDPIPILAYATKEEGESIESLMEG